MRFESAFIIIIAAANATAKEPNMRFIEGWGLALLVAAGSIAGVAAQPVNLGAST